MYLRNMKDEFVKEFVICNLIQKRKYIFVTDTMSKKRKHNFYHELCLRKMMDEIILQSIFIKKETWFCCRHYT